MLRRKSASTFAVGKFFCLLEPGLFTVRRLGRCMKAIRLYTSRALACSKPTAALEHHKMRRTHYLLANILSAGVTSHSRQSDTCIIRFQQFNSIRHNARASKYNPSITMTWVVCTWSHGKQNTTINNQTAVVLTWYRQIHTATTATCSPALLAVNSYGLPARQRSNVQQRPDSERVQHHLGLSVEQSTAFARGRRQRVGTARGCLRTTLNGKLPPHGSVSTFLCHA